MHGILEVYADKISHGYLFALNIGISVVKSKGILGKIGFERVRLNKSYNGAFFYKPYDSLEEIAKEINSFYLKGFKEVFLYDSSTKKELSSKIKEINPEIKIAGPIRRFFIKFEESHKIDYKEKQRLIKELFLKTKN